MPKNEIKKTIPEWILYAFRLFYAESACNRLFAADSIATWETVASKKLQNKDEQCAVEFWRYDPKKLSNNENVDRLSSLLLFGKIEMRG